MADKNSGNLMRSIRPDAVDDDQIVPGTRVEKRNQGNRPEGQQYSSRVAAAHRQDNGEEGDAEKNRQELGIAHIERSRGDGLRQTWSRALRGYQQGVVATVPAAVAASVVAALASWPSPLEATAEQIMEWTPIGLAEFLLFHAGQVSRPLALLGALAVCMLIGGVAGVIRSAFGCGLFRQTAGSLLAALFLLVVFTVALPSSVPATAFTFVAALVIALAVTSLPRRHATGRREFIEKNLAVLGGAAVLLSVFSVQPLLRALALRTLFPFRAPRGLRLAGLTSLVTPVDRYYQMDKVLQFPQIGPPDWTLTVDGLVDRPLRLDYGTLLARRPVHRYVTTECVDNPVGGALMSTALWTGLPVSDLLRASGARADMVIFHSADEYREATPRRVLEDNGALIAYAMNGQRLPVAHGYPARLVLPGIYGFKSVKWLTRLEVVQGPYAGNWRSHGWTETARVHTTCRIDVARRAGTSVVVAGVAFAGHRGIRAVEVRANGGPWQRATLGPVLSRDTWVQWTVRLVGAGSARVEVRAIDGEGQVQTGLIHSAYPDGSTGWASVTV